MKPAGSDRLGSLDATCLLWPAREQACVVSAATSCIPYASCTAALTGHEQPVFMHECWVRTVAQRHSIIQLALFGAKHGGVRESDRTLKRLDQSFSPRNPTKWSSGMPECPPNFHGESLRKRLERCLSSERALHLYDSSRNKSGRRSDIDTGRKKSGAGKEGERRRDAGQQFGVNGIGSFLIQLESLFTILCHTGQKERGGTPNVGQCAGQGLPITSKAFDAWCFRVRSGPREGGYGSPLHPIQATSFPLKTSFSTHKTTSKE